ncbi:MAG TPA: T9SS type A sorting domain-containing protein [Bacteroidales bacterium]|nr:T9SS type A sorting domain-containing protein [Bacteroidales bacterium]HPS16045.1 T9SS type A sorting domain-containing protein [Bacteroidales bacterium]
MEPANGSYNYKVPAVNIPNNNTADEANTPSVIGATDKINYSIGKNGWIIVDMLLSINNISGNDFKVYEGDISAESYTCYASQSMDGPWTSLGTGTGSKEFYLSTLSKARFIKIVDDNDGTVTSADVGFDLDVIEVYGATVNISSIENKNKFSVNVFPNPFNDEISFEYYIDNALKGYITFYNITGEKVKQFSEEKYFPGSYSIHLGSSELKAGIYNYVISADNEKIIPVSKIIVKQ